MKRIVSLLISIVISISLVGCSSTNKNDDTQEEKTYTSKDDEKVDFDMSIQDILNKKYEDYVCQVGSIDANGNTVITIKTNFNAEGIDKDTLLSQIEDLPQFDKLISDLEKKYEAKGFKGGIYFMLMSKDDVCLYEINHSADKVDRDATLYPVFSNSSNGNNENSDSESKDNSNNSNQSSKASISNKKSENKSNVKDEENDDSKISCPNCSRKISVNNNIEINCPYCGYYHNSDTKEDEIYYDDYNSNNNSNNNKGSAIDSEDGIKYQYKDEDGNTVKEYENGDKVTEYND